MKKTTKKKAPKKSYYVKKLDKVFSEYIRKQAADFQGFSTCYTCGARKHWREMQNGHYISRSVMALRWDQTNARVQCVGCNVFKGGNYTEYSYRLLQEIGKRGLDKLMKKKKEIKQWSIDEIKREIEKYEDLIRIS